MRRYNIYKFAFEVNCNSLCISVTSMLYKVHVFVRLKDRHFLCSFSCIEYDISLVPRRQYINSEHSNVSGLLVRSG
jgi:hypothetical protein